MRKTDELWKFHFQGQRTYQTDEEKFRWADEFNKSWVQFIESFQVDDCKD